MEGHRDAMLISSSSTSPSRAVEDDKPLVDWARMSAGGSVLTKHRLVERAALSQRDRRCFDVGGPFEHEHFGGFSEAFFMYAA